MGEARADRKDKEKERGGTREGSGRAPGQRRCGCQLLHHWILLFSPKCHILRFRFLILQGKGFVHRQTGLIELQPARLSHNPRAAMITHASRHVRQVNQRGSLETLRGGGAGLQPSIQV